MNAVIYPEITGGEMLMHDSMPVMNMNSEPKDIITLNYSMLRSPIKTTLPAAPVRARHAVLGFNILYPCVLRPMQDLIRMAN
ncbi:MAG: hypothetical protein ABIN89_24250 [Chitinophagaceae bacterium]